MKNELVTSNESERYLSFDLGKEEYAVPLLKVKEVIAMTEITPVPYTQPYYLGIMNLRGQVISVVDLRLKFKMKESARGPETAIIILDLEAACIGVVVDSVNRVLSVQTSQVSSPPDVDSATNDYVTGIIKIDEKLVLRIDISKVLNIQELASKLVKTA